ncbi:MAG TPA: response regulator [Phycisphaerae bacterium]|nr:response regulator [Phycisphaerales bacterium]HRX86336.1 response regulator [Phycisphaerae bacterium]
MSNILIVDDVPACRETVAEILMGQDHTVFCAERGDEAIDVLTRERVDLMLLDIVMPRLDGLSLLRIVRRNQEWRDLPVILLTGTSDREHVRTAAALGVQGYLLKAQLSADVLSARVEQCLAQRAEAGGPPTSG